MIRKGFTLIEILLVIGILLLLAAILFPVITAARESAKVAPCTSNLRQIHLAWSMYADDNDGQWPASLAVLWPANAAVMVCNSDHRTESERERFQIGSIPTSYFAPPPLPRFRHDLLQADSNPGIAVCVLHGHLAKDASSPDIRLNTRGLTLRLHIDGSVERAQVPLYCTRDTGHGKSCGRSIWHLLTPTKCPEWFCSGEDEPSGD
jgi:prepilin-type N-terminal cleavage/methylation domain-containing protein